MSEIQILDETIKNLSEQFELQDPALKPDVLHTNENIILDAAKRILADKIQDLMENNFEKLSSILYRIDVSPVKVKDVFANSKLWDIPLELAQLIIDRQVQKVKTRNYYRSQNNMLD